MPWNIEALVEKVRGELYVSITKRKNIISKKVSLVIRT